MSPAGDSAGAGGAVGKAGGAAPAVLGLCGAARPGSLNHLLLSVALEGARERGAAVSTVELHELGLPLFDDGMGPVPEGAVRLRALVAAAAALIVAAPEANGSYAPALANALAWLEPAALRGKAAGLVGAAPGEGAIKALNALSLTLSYMGVLVLPTPIAVGAAAFADGGKLNDPRLDGRVRDVGRAVAQFLTRRS